MTRALSKFAPGNRPPGRMSPRRPDVKNKTGTYLHDIWWSRVQARNLI
jgi:hypothetical protein